MILANPPFAAKLDTDQVSKDVLSLAKTKDTELLFISLMLRMLKVGGRAGVIVPTGVLFNTNKAYKAVRKELVENQNLQAVINMPSGVFQPYTGVSTAVLIFTKTNSGGTGNVWFYDMLADGYSLDVRRNMSEANDIPDIIKRWDNLGQEEKRLRTDKSFVVRVNEIVENDWDLSINRYKEIQYKETEYDTPKNIIAEIMKLDQERREALNTLNNLLR